MIVQTPGSSISSRHHGARPDGRGSSASAQTPITPDRNKYTPAQDVQIGQEAAQEVARELPMLND